MLTVTAEKLRDFSLCRYLYDKKSEEAAATKKQKYNFVRDNRFDLANTAFNKMVANALWETLDGGEFPTIDKMYKKWESIWFKNYEKDDILTGEHEPGRNIYTTSNSMLPAINFVHDNLSDKSLRTIAIAEPYVYELAGNVVQGEIHVAVTQNNQRKLLYFTTSMKKSWRYGTQNYFRVILDAIAFAKASPDGEIPVAEIYYIKAGQQPTREQRIITDTQIKQVTELIRDMDSTTLFPPSPGNYWCKECKFASKCSKWPD